MNVIFYPSTVSGDVVPPSSKSMAHRLLICAGLAKGNSVLRRLDLSDDVSATIRCLIALGADIQIDGNTCFIKGTDIMNAPSAVLSCGESASTLRFLIPLCLLNGNRYVFTGSPRLFARPLDPYEEYFRRNQIEFTRGDTGLVIQGRLAGGTTELNAEIGSQFVSGFLFASPLHPVDTELRLRGEIVSRPYIRMTVSALRSAGIAVFDPDERRYLISGRQCYNPVSTLIEVDWSNAAYLFALNMLGGSIKIDGLDPQSLQGDSRIVVFLEEIRNARPQIDISDCPDLGPVLMATAAACNGAVLTGTRRLQFKESDRGRAMAEELSKFGVETLISDDKIIVGNGLNAPSEPVFSHNDHRIAMALSVLLTKTGGTLTGAEAVCKSWPDFYDTMRMIHTDLKVILC